MTFSRTTWNTEKPRPASGRLIVNIILQSSVAGEGTNTVLITSVPRKGRKWVHAWYSESKDKPFGVRRWRWQTKTKLLGNPFHQIVLLQNPQVCLLFCFIYFSSVSLQLSQALWGSVRLYLGTVVLWNKSQHANMFKMTMPRCSWDSSSEDNECPYKLSWQSILCLAWLKSLLKQVTKLHINSSAVTNENILGCGSVLRSVNMQLRQHIW